MIIPHKLSQVAACETIWTISLIVKVFGCRPHEGGAANTGAGVRKPPREETALEGTKAVPQALWRFESRGRDL